MNPKSKIPEPMKKPILLYLTTLALTALCGGAAAGQASGLHQVVVAGVVNLAAGDFLFV